MSSRIATTFERCKAENRAALVTYIMGGHPDKATSQQVFESLAESGADIIELGVPFSDPMADGPTIQQAAISALEENTRPRDILAMVEQFRTKNDTTPIILMGYYNVILHYGIQAFVKDAAKAGIDGLIVVDLPPEEDHALRQEAQKSQLDLIRLITPTSTPERIKLINEHASGFLYYVSIAGITGTKSADNKDVKKAYEMVKQHTTHPVVVGFGIKDQAGAHEVAQFSDGVVVGSAVVHLLNHLPDQSGASLRPFIDSLAKAMVRK